MVQPDVSDQFNVPINLVRMSMPDIARSGMAGIALLTFWHGDLKRLCGCHGSG